MTLEQAQVHYANNPAVRCAKTRLIMILHSVTIHDEKYFGSDKPHVFGANKDGAGITLYEPDRDKHAEVIV